MFKQANFNFNLSRQELQCDTLQKAVVENLSVFHFTLHCNQNCHYCSTQRVWG